MRFDVFTLFPEVMEDYLQAGVLGKAQESSRIEVHLHHLRDYTTDRHRTTDDEPYGGGGGMVMKPEPIFAAVESVLGDSRGEVPVILLTPQGRVFDQTIARELARSERIALICGRYEGVDERIREHLATDEISIGDYVLSGGELAAMVLIDSISRLLPGVLGDSEATEKDSHTNGLLEHPHYTRPPVFRDWEVPEVLRSGDHARIARWRTEQSLRRTYLRRPELLDQTRLTDEEREILEELIQAEEEDSK
ncbi:MAG: tRNA (guanosine(37)-N1)-methyltransferase TrmD [Anaerolineales bacterium]|nr:MAG: tRNA (guanosine(37)-N1)-methyltransferase TrmD [Anaerolineales bacterium]